MLQNLLDEVISGQPNDANFPSKFRLALPMNSATGIGGGAYPLFPPVVGVEVGVGR